MTGIARRRLLAGTGTALAAALAGCSSDGDSASDGHETPEEDEPAEPTEDVLLESVSVHAE